MAGAERVAPRFGAGQGGFTLIELLVVLLIVAAVLSLALPNLSRPPGRPQIVAGAHEVAATLREARGLAIATNRPAAFFADVDRNVFWAAGGKLRSFPEGIVLTVRTVENDVLGGSAAIRFYPDGSSTGGGVTLATAHLRYAVQVSWLTGSISIREVSDGRR